MVDLGILGRFQKPVEVEVKCVALPILDVRSIEDTVTSANGAHIQTLGPTGLARFLQKIGPVEATIDHWN